MKEQINKKKVAKEDCSLLLKTLEEENINTIKKTTKEIITKISLYGTAYSSCLWLPLQSLFRKTFKELDQEKTMQEMNIKKEIIKIVNEFLKVNSHIIEKGELEFYAKKTVNILLTNVLENELLLILLKTCSFIIKTNGKVSAYILPYSLKIFSINSSNENNSIFNFSRLILKDLDLFIHPVYYSEYKIENNKEIEESLFIKDIPAK